MKRILPIMIIAILTLAVLLTGCATATPTPTPKPMATPTPAGPFVNTLPIVTTPLTLTYLIEDTGETGKSYNTDKSYVGEYVAQQTGITQKFEALPAKDYAQGVQLRVAAGTNLPDLIEMRGSDDGAYLVTYFDSGLLLPLNDLIDQYAPTIKGIFEKYPEYKRILTLATGDVVALANVVEAKQYCKTVMIRKDWVDNLGLQMPTNLDELYNVCKAFIEQDPNGNSQNDEVGLACEELGGSRLLSLGFGLQLQNAFTMSDGKVMYEYMKPEYKSFLEWMNKAYTDKVLIQDIMTMEEDPFLALISGNVCGTFVGCDIGTFAGFNDPDVWVKQATPDAEWMVVNFKAGGTWPDPALTKVRIASRSKTYAITTACKNPVEAIRLFDYMMTDEFQNSDALRMQESDVPAGYLLGRGYYPDKITDARIYGNRSKMPYLAADKTLLDSYNAIIADVLTHVVEPFAQPIAQSKDEAKLLSVAISAINKYNMEMYGKFITGEASLDTFDDYIATLKKMGIEEILGVMQKNYDSANK